MGQGINKALVATILAKMQQCVKNNNFYVEPNRPENISFIQEYNLTDIIQASILLDLAVEDYCESEESRRFPGKYIHVFAPRVDLINHDGKAERLTMYVKFEIREMENGETVAVISFHQLNFHIFYAFP